jgi:hypothetical protein
MFRLAKKLEHVQAASRTKRIGAIRPSFELLKRDIETHLRFGIVLGKHTIPPIME